MNNVVINKVTDTVIKITSSKRFIKELSNEVFCVLLKAATRCMSRSRSARLRARRGSVDDRTLTPRPAGSRAAPEIPGGSRSKSAESPVGRCSRPIQSCWRQSRRGCFCSRQRFKMTQRVALLQVTQNRLANDDISLV